MHTVRSFPFVIVIALALSACNTRKPQVESGPHRQYQLSGKIVALNSKHRTATIDAAAVPNFMEAMTMEYPISNSVDFKSLHVGEKIYATVNVTASGDDYNLSNIREQHGAQPK